MSSAAKFSAFLASGMLASLALLGGARAAGAAWYSQARASCAGSSEQIVCYHRQIRGRAGLPRLRVSVRLSRAARLKAKRIVRCHRFTHEPCGEPFERQFRVAGYLPWSGSWIVGENLASGWESSWAAFDALMHSRSHRENILERSYRDIGVAQVGSPWGSLWVVEYGHRW